MAPQLTDADGQSIVRPDGTLVEHARTFTSIWNSVSKAYSYRWDEALRNAPENALAMWRDVKWRALLQERTGPTINSDWQLDVDNPLDKRQAEVKDGLTKLAKDIPRFRRLKSTLMNAPWYGRYGAQLVWSRGPLGFGVRNRKQVNNSHEPVNGDKIQYQWDGTPVVMVDSTTYNEFSARDPESVITLDRGGFGLRLYKPEYRDRFIIHTHIVDDADYFEGEMAGASQGVGLRSICYWSDWMCRETQSWMFGHMEATGMMDVLIFNYEEGNKAQKSAAEANARRVTGKIAFTFPRKAGDSFQLVDRIDANLQGVQVLKDLIESYFERWQERMVVGQSMSAGGGGSGGLEGDGRAEFASDTKGQILKFDGDNLDETLTVDLIGPMLRYNYPWADFPVRFKSVNPEADKEKKLENGQTLVSIGVAVKADELRDAAGFSKPLDTDEQVGGQPKPMLGSDGMPMNVRIAGQSGLPPKPGESGRAASTEPPAKLPEQMQQYAAAHAPAGGVTVQGKEYKGGEFIPGEVMAKATTAEKESVEGGRAASKPKPAKGRFKLPEVDFDNARFKHGYTLIDPFTSRTKAEAAGGDAVAQLHGSWWAMKKGKESPEPQEIALGDKPSAKPAGKPAPAEKPSRPSLESLPLKEFASTVQAAADEYPHGYGGNKVFIGDLFDHFAKSEPTLTLEKFKAMLRKANMEGELQLSRADEVHAMHPGDVSKSKTSLIPGMDGFEAHFVLTPDNPKRTERHTAEEKDAARKKQVEEEHAVSVQAEKERQAAMVYRPPA